MKCFSFLYFFFFSILSMAQFDPSKEWFTLENFFDTEALQNNSVESIIIYKSDKRDDAVFSAERKLAEYFFSTDGKLVESRKFVPMNSRIDTSIYQYQYSGSKLSSKTEIEGPFSFRYCYIWLNDSSFQEVKIDNKTLDTNYVHRVEIREEGLKKKYTYYNSVGRPMKSEWITTNLKGRIISKKESYARSLSFVVDSFNYNATQLTDRLKWNTIGGHKRSIWEYTYLEGFLDFIKKIQEDEVVTKLAVLYNEMQLIKSIVKRDVKEKTISVYRAEYEYYVTQR